MRCPRPTRPAVLRTAARIKNAAAGIELLVTAKAMQAPEFAPSGGDKAEDKLAKATGRSPKAAKQAIEASKAAAGLPVLDDAVRSGELSAEQAAMIADAAKNDPGAQSDLIAKAKSEDLKGLRDACERTKAAADPDPEGRHRRVHARRRVTHWSDPDGARCGMWSMTPERSAEVEHVMDAFTEAEFKKARARAAGNRTRRTGLTPWWPWPAPRPAPGRGCRSRRNWSSVAITPRSSGATPIPVRCVRSAGSARSRSRWRGRSSTTASSKPCSTTGPTSGW